MKLNIELAARTERTNMPAFRTKLKNRSEIAEHTMAFHLEKPSGFEFKPGQYLDLTLIDPPEMDS